MVEMVMKCDHFNGIPNHAMTSDIIYCCCREIYNSFEYLKLILKYSKKNEEMICAGLDYSSRSYSKETFVRYWALDRLLRSRYCNKEWLDVLLFKILDVIPMEKAKFGIKSLKWSLEYCQKNGKI